MLPQSPLTRLAAGIVVALGLGALLAGCSVTPKVTGPKAVTAEAGAFPVTLKDALGSAIITEAPQRVVTIGATTHDAVLALGITPVGMSDQSWGGDADGYLPWFREVVERRGDPLPHILTETDTELDIEEILALDPDVILAPYSGLTQKQYERLSEFTRVVAYRDRAWSSSWQEIMTVTGDALGRPAEARRQISETEALIASRAAANPEFAEKTYLYGAAMSEGSTDISLYLPVDTRVQLVQELGFNLAPDFAATIGDVDDGFYATLSIEQLTDIHTDIYLAWGEDAEIKATRENPVFARWEPVARNNTLLLADRELLMATSATSVLSIPWALDRFIPLLREAVAGTVTAENSALSDKR